ncbi:hypothetical protein POM88_038871 [Heracleum sosnowskyi]|uniref:protein-disulfide reductase n=1 Tax=Heracleum sosnowskyi TaxID=360622 RepID=A0AAD8HC42_9APIA|nr:hypothetical protein POM88_038871 [Heracleum sosnowskyi]
MDFTLSLSVLIKKSRLSETKRDSKVCFCGLVFSISVSSITLSELLSRNDSESQGSNLRPFLNDASSLSRVEDDDRSFDKEFSYMPWLAIPHSNLVSRAMLVTVSRVLTDDGASIVDKYGGEGYPFTPEHLQELQEWEELARNNLTLRIPLDDDEASFKRGRKFEPWLSLPFLDNSCEKLIRFFKISALSSLVILGTDGETIHPNVPEVPRKIILHYFAALRCPTCDIITKSLKRMCYELELEGKRSFMKIIFISLDRDKTSFEQHFSKMSWLTLPFDMRIESLIDLFGVRGTSKLVVIELSGEIVTTEARDLVYFFGLKAYPFTEERVKKMEEDVSCTPEPSLVTIAHDPFDPENIQIWQSCNGLLLCSTNPYSPVDHYDDYVNNPPTNQVATLPKHPDRSIMVKGLAFDPLKSPHYKVIAFSYRCLHGFRCNKDQIILWTFIFTILKLELGGSRENHMKTKPGVGRNISKASYEWSWYFGESEDHLHYIEVCPYATSFSVYEMKSDYSEWFVKYEIDLAPISKVVPEMTNHKAHFNGGNNNAVGVLSLIRRENFQEDSFLLLEIPSKAIGYNLEDRSFKVIWDFPVDFGLDSLEKVHTCPFRMLRVSQYIETLSCV